MAELQRRLAKNKNLAVSLSLATVLVALSVLVGLVLNVVMLILKARKETIITRSFEPALAGWTLWDVGKVVILFLFLTYSLLITETGLAVIFPAIRTQATLRSSINTTILDFMVIFFIFYFVIIQRKQKLIDLGLSCKNFFKNIVYGIAGYLAAIPTLILVLVAVMGIVTIFKYQPPPQPVLELFVQEKKIPALVYISLFVAIFGPIAEEIFFRGFMYNAIKAKFGVKKGLFLSSFLFAAFHMHLVGFLPIMLLGLLLAYLYEKTGSLIASITVHIIHNSLMIVLIFLMKELYF